jgi:hypothetical protein
MSTFSGDNVGAGKQNLSSVDKDNPSKEEIDNASKTSADGGPIQDDPRNPNEPNATLTESASETEDRHVASTELPVKDVTDPSTQADTAVADDAGENIVPGAAVGPDPAGVVRNDHGRVAYAPPGSYDAAMNGVQEDAAGFVDSVGTDNSSKSGTRV